MFKSQKSNSLKKKIRNKKKTLKYFVPIKQKGGQNNCPPWLFPNQPKIKYLNNQTGPFWFYPNFTWPPTGSDASNSRNFLSHLVDFPVN